MSPLPSTAPVATQFGERNLDAELAWQHGMAAADDLGLTAELIPLPSNDPGAWRCALRNNGVEVPHGLGWGKGETARVGALFEALEHHLSLGVPPPESEIALRPFHTSLAGDAALAAVADGPQQPLVCLRYQSLRDNSEIDLPLFLSTPNYHEDDALRARLGDEYDYLGVARYAMNNGWAAGTRTDDALVHALNETIERDAMSLLLVEQFLASIPPRLRITDPSTLPTPLADLLRHARERTGAPVWLVDMTTDLGVPAYWAYAPAPTGEPARLRGAGASLSRYYAIERALTELIQLHAITATGTRYVDAPTDFTAPYPPMHRCYLADLTPLLDTAQVVPYADTTAPDTPAGHLDTLVGILRDRGFTPYARQRYATEHLVVLHVFVPGLERFMVITDGQLVLPGSRGRARTQ
ncbi:MAG TPA: YcaO-like family protein [Pseudonocardiaceae bacterium]|jgi:ribosomal protein S12 methylthiotransferase accessory factor